MKRIFLSALVFAPLVASAQWAVYDDAVKKQLEKINDVTRVTNDLEKQFKNQLAAASPGQNLTLGEGASQSVLKGLDTKFETLTDLTDADKEKYVASGQDCGSDGGAAASATGKSSLLNHYNACVGLRNLRLLTLKQSQQLLKTLDGRRKEIVTLVTNSRAVSEKSGQMQRYHFELQAIQALMQADAMQLQVVMDGYKQREAVYQMQMVEAKRAIESSRFDSKKAPRRIAVPFIPPP